MTVADGGTPRAHRRSHSPVHAGAWPWTEEQHVLLDMLLHDAPVAFVLYDRDMRYRRINRLLADVNGLPVEAHLGHRPSEVIEPDVAEAVEAMLERVLSTGEEVVQDVRTVDRRTGEERFWQSQCFPARDAQGAVTGVAVIVVEVTQRLRTEEALRVANRRTLRLQQVTADLAGALTVAEVTTLVAALGREAVGAAWSTVVLAPDVGEAQPAAPPCVQRLTAEVIHSGRPLYLSGPEDLRGRCPDDEVRTLLSGTSERSWVVVPLLSSGRVLGAIRFAFDAPRVLDQEERTFCQALAGQCVLALERARLYEREHQAALTLTRSLLPDVLPEVPGTDVAARYLPGGGADTGGDWYDVFRLPSGEHAFVVGDVMGKGLQAAAGMGRMRAALRALALAGGTPSEVLAGLDRLSDATESLEHLVTVTLGVLADDGEVLVSSAGHPPVVLVPAGGSPRLLVPDPPGTPIGVQEPRRHWRTRLAPGDTVLAYTDGLVETRGRPIGEGLDLLLEVVGRAADDPLDRLLDAVLAGMGAAQRRDDDVTLVALRRRVPG